jgi:hypothetical protein
MSAGAGVVGTGTGLPSQCAVRLPQIMHGGLFSEDGVTLDDIRKIERNRQPPDSGEWCQARGQEWLGLPSELQAWAWHWHWHSGLHALGKE